MQSPAAARDLNEEGYQRRVALHREVPHLKPKVLRERLLVLVA
jgi:DNA-binding HxlR family transcriptional regulator